MTEEIPAELQNLDFAEVGNNQQNIWKLRDELNATRRWLRENTVNETENPTVEYPVQTAQTPCIHENSYQMKPGLMRCKDCKKVYKV